MKSMWPPSAAISFMTYFHRAGGGGAWPPRPPWIRYWGVCLGELSALRGGVCPGGVCLEGGCLPRGCLLGGVCPGGVSAPVHTGMHTPPVDRMTDMCKNITLPQLRCTWRGIRQ